MREILFPGPVYSQTPFCGHVKGIAQPLPHLTRIDTTFDELACRQVTRGKHLGVDNPFRTLRAKLITYKLVEFRQSHTANLPKYP
ncbi:hypothetical protein HMPREF3101_02730 [Corynebacterium sp. HMSC29G08]|nr:hypothetical protein HMPREF3101_02730 [Corynebacterium sp. HMSC29G08]